MIIIPIRTETPLRRSPVVNYWLLALNVVLFILFSEPFGGVEMVAFKNTHLVFSSDQPVLYQFFTYQFVHGDVFHLLGNMLFLWVFGNSVNAKMGHFAYLLFYLAGGVFAAWGYAVMQDTPFKLIGASGAIAAVTTAYLVLFPRSRVTVMVWIIFFIHFFEWPAMLLIGLKIILWDNLIAPHIGSGGPDAVAYGAHVAGYIFGFAAALGMLLIRAIPRDQFDMLAIWDRWNRRHGLITDRAGTRRGRGSIVSTTTTLEPVPTADAPDVFSRRRTEIASHLEGGRTDRAAALYEQIIAEDPSQTLPLAQQMQVARAFYASGRFPQAAVAFSRYLECYARADDAADVTLLLGIIYARDLQQYERAEKTLDKANAQLSDSTRRGQCDRWLRDVRAALGRPSP